MRLIILALQCVLKCVIPLIPQKFVNANSLFLLLLLLLVFRDTRYFPSVYSCVRCCGPSLSHQRLVFSPDPKIKRTEVVKKPSVNVKQTFSNRNITESTPVTFDVRVARSGVVAVYEVVTIETVTY